MFLKQTSETMLLQIINSTYALRAFHASLKIKSLNTVTPNPRFSEPNGAKSDPDNIDTYRTLSNANKMT